MKLVAMVCLAASLVACPPSPVNPQPDADAQSPPQPPPQPPPTPSSSTCVDACRSLTAAGCPEGNASCAGTCAHILDAKLTPLDVACLANAKSKADVRACGVACADAR